MGGGRGFKLELPLHIRDAVSGIGKLRGEIDLIINVYDARSPMTGEACRSLLSTFPGAEILSLASKSDLSGVRRTNAFDLRDRRNRAKILGLIRGSLAEKDGAYRKRGYVSHFQILVMGLPNVGKSTLINLLKGRRIAVSENRPGVTRKVIRHHLGDNLWLYDSPGIFVYGGDPEGRIFDRLLLTNAIPAPVKDYSDVLERAYAYLSRHYPKELSELLGREIPPDYRSFLEDFARRFNFRIREGELDLERAEARFLGLLRDGRIKVFWDLDGVQ